MFTPRTGTVSGSVPAGEQRQHQLAEEFGSQMQKEGEGGEDDLGLSARGPAKAQRPIHGLKRGRSFTEAGVAHAQKSAVASADGEVGDATRPSVIHG